MVKTAEGKMSRRTKKIRRRKASTQKDLPSTSSLQSRSSLLMFPKREVLLGKEATKVSPAILKPGAIRQISCKQGYLAVVAADGTVVVFGRADGAGCQTHTGNPKHIKLKKKAKVDSLDCEASRLLLLSCEGKLFEHSIESSAKSEPRLLNTLEKVQIVQIACGDHHSMALSKGGEIFTWGQNEYGQLGVGKKISSIQKPQLVQVLQGIPVNTIASGATHSMALSLSGTVYSWGKNACGQLGLGDTEDRYFPTYVKALEYKKTVFIACGGEHTAALSKDGLVCTFGAGGCGQLGHNSRCNELFPRLVAELFGTRVSQVACGRWHTLVYIPDLKEVYSFGSGAEGQLGKEGKCDQLIPLPIGLTVNGRNFKHEENGSEEVTKIVAGENQSIVLCLKEKKVRVKRTLATVEEEKVDKWVSNSNPNYWQQNMKQEIKLIFSSVSCVNGSFLDKRDKHFRTSQKDAGIDMSAVFLFAEKIAAKPRISKEVIKAMKTLLQSLPASATSPEALRVFLIVPIIIQKQDINLDDLQEQLAGAVLRLQRDAGQTLESLSSNLEKPFFMDLVRMYQRLSSTKLSLIIGQLYRPRENTQKEDYIWPVQILQILYEVNCKAGFKIQENNFYVPEVKKLLIILHMGYTQSAEVPSLYSFRCILDKLTEFPCIFELEDKIKVLELEYLICTFFGIHSELHVRRQELVHDTWRWIRSATRDMFLQPIKVCFEGERGIDLGGVSQEFFTILRQQLCAPEARIFRHYEESHLIWFSSQAPAQEDTHFLIGTLFGMALYNLKILPFPFPLALFKKMADIPPTLEDLIELSPTEGRSLQQVLDEQYDDIIESYFLNFTIMKEGSSDVIELKENGANIPVSQWNREEYVNAYVNYIFNDSVEKQFSDFMCGFLRGCPMEMWKIFCPIELQMVLHGHTEYDWEQLEKNAKYRDYEKSDETIKNFWAVFHDLPEEMKKNFLGTDRVPAQGMERFTFTIADYGKENPDQWHPEAHTCFRILLLPRYTQRDILKEMFLRALEQYEKFGLL